MVSSQGVRPWRAGNALAAVSYFIPAHNHRSRATARRPSVSGNDGGAGSKHVVRAILTTWRIRPERRMRGQTMACKRVEAIEGLAHVHRLAIEVDPNLALGEEHHTTHQMEYQAAIWTGNAGPPRYWRTTCGAGRTSRKPIVPNFSGGWCSTPR